MFSRMQCNVKMNKWECFQCDKGAMLRWISLFSSSSLCNDKDAILRWISEDVFKFFFMQWKGCNVKMNKWGCFEFFSMQWQGCNVKMNKWECFQVLLYGMTRMQR